MVLLPWPWFSISPVIPLLLPRQKVRSWKVRISIPFALQTPRRSYGWPDIQGLRTTHAARAPGWSDFSIRRPSLRECRTGDLFRTDFCFCFSPPLSPPPGVCVYVRLPGDLPVMEGEDWIPDPREEFAPNYRQSNSATKAARDLA